MKKLFSFALVCIMLLAFAISAIAVPSYDSTVSVNVSPMYGEEVVLDGDSVEVTFVVDITNISKSGDLPQVIVNPLGDNTTSVEASKITKIANKETVTFEFAVTYTKIGEYAFWVNIKNMQGNSGKWNYEFTSLKATVKIVEPKEESTLLDKLNDAIKNGDVSGTGPIVLTVDGVDYAFISNGGNYNGNGSLFCRVDGVEYRLERNSKGLIGVFLN